MKWSIRTRLTLWYSGVVVAVLIAGAIAVAALQIRVGIERLDAELERLMLTLEGVMRTEFREGLDLQAAADEASAEVVAPDRSLFLLGTDGRRLASWGRALPSVWAPPDGVSSLHDLTLGGKAFRVLRRTVSFEGHDYIAAVVVSLESFEQEQAAMRRALAGGVLLALLVAAAGGWIVGQQTLKPLGQMARQAAAIPGRETSIRVEAPNEHDELGRLAHAFNGLLDRLGRALHAQRQFMADASHELRTPVSVVHTTAQVILQRDARPEPEYREALTIVSDQATRLARLVDAMFLLSRAEAQGIPLIREPLYLDEVVHDCARALRVFADQRGVRVSVSGVVEVGFCGDNTLLRQMVGNLLDNAIRHAKPQGTVSATLHRDTGGIRLRVRDNGPGIPAADHERVFERFVRLGSGPGGAGLGLPIARWIVEAHGGRLQLESSDANGTCFTATLPVSAG